MLKYLKMVTVLIIPKMILLFILTRHQLSFMSTEYDIYVLIDHDVSYLKQIKFIWRELYLNHNYLFY